MAAEDSLDHLGPHFWVAYPLEINERFELWQRRLEDTCKISG